MSDLEKKRASLLDDLGRAMAGAGIPTHFQGGLARFLVCGIRPGHFLTAVLKNDLREAMARGDEESRAGLFSIVSFLYNKTPAPCSGSPEKVAAWCAKTDEERAASIGVGIPMNDTDQVGVKAQTVWKYSIPLAGGIHSVSMPAGAEFLHVADQDGLVCAWFRVRPSEPAEIRRFRIIGTGHAIANENYLGSVLMMDGALVWHLFEEAR